MKGRTLYTWNKIKKPRGFKYVDTKPYPHELMSKPSKYDLEVRAKIAKEKAEKANG